MKRSRYIALVGMGASALTLTACADSNELIPVKAYASIEACVGDGFAKDQCAANFYAAEERYEEVYPKYTSQFDCEDNAGEGKCELDRPASREASWRPSMIGFIMAGARSGVRPQALVANRTSPSGRATAAGAGIVAKGANVKLAASALSTPTSSQVARAHTQARGGFGGTASRVTAGFSGSSARAGG